MIIFNLIILILMILSVVGMIYYRIRYRDASVKNQTILYIPFGLILFAVICYGISYQGETNILKIFVNAFNATIKSIALDDASGKMEMAMSNLFFSVNYYMNIIIIFYITFSIAIELFIKKIRNILCNVRLQDGTLVLVCDPNDEAKAFIESAEKLAVILNKSDDDFKKFLLDNKKTFTVGLTSRHLNDYLRKGGSCVSLLEDKEDIVKLTRMIEKSNNTVFIKITKDISYAMESIVNNFSNVILFDKYDIIAKQFVLESGIDDFILPSIDTKTGLLKEDNDISFTFIGFGSVNSRIYLDLIVNNQYAKLIDNHIATYGVKYNIFSNRDMDSIDLNHNLRRIRYIKDRNDYLPWPDETYRLYTSVIDVNSFSFYKDLRENLVQTNGKNIIIIATGNDLRNIDLALKLDDEIKAWRLKSDYIIYTRTKNDYRQTFANRASIRFFGLDKEAINEANIVKQDNLIMAKKRAALYAGSENVEEVWKELSLKKRISNQSSIQSIFHKLSLMGLKVSSKSDGSLTREEFMQVYDTNKEITYKDGAISYPLYFSNQVNIRNTLAFLEHNRWVMSQIVQGYIPLKKSCLDYKDGKIYKDDAGLREHICITSFSGLDAYFDMAAKLLVNNEGLSYDEAYYQVENKRYDYQIMDEAYDMITGIGYYIVRR